MDRDMYLWEMMVAVLIQRGEPVTYREMKDAIWLAFPSYGSKMESKYGEKTFPEMRVRMHQAVGEHPEAFTATRSEGVVLLGLPATETDEAEDEDEAIEDSTEVRPSVYWYSFPAYMRTDSPYPIKIGFGANPAVRIVQQCTAMPEAPVVLGTYEHREARTLERALHAILAVRGKRKSDAPGAEWFNTTHEEVTALIALILGGVP